MRPLTLQEMVVAIAGRVYGQITIPRVTSVSTDSRDVAPGAIFFAIRGERHDGHAFVEAALAKGATAAVVSDLSGVPESLRACGQLIQVTDTVEALGKLAAWYRRQFAAQVIAVAGSNGKTTTKDMIAAALSAGRRGRAAKASFNNAIGVPLTLLAVEPADEFVVVEIGTNHPGEVMTLGRIAQPDMAILTSIGEEHLEFFGDIQSVAREEYALLGALRRRGFVAVSCQAAEHAPARIKSDFTILTYGLEEQADLRATDLSSTLEGQRFKVNGRHEYLLPVLGRHNVNNALAAVAVGTRFRMTPDEIASGLRSARLPPMRLERSNIGPFVLINDAYNANPSSMRAALAVMDQLREVGRKVLVLGDMKELGPETGRCHRTLGQDAGRSTAQVIVAVGSYSRHVCDGATAACGTTKRIYQFATVEMLSEKIGELLEPGDVILLKASRGVRLERLIGPIEQAAMATAT